MNPSTPSPSVPGNTCCFDSPDCLLFISDEPGDTSVRPIRPELLKWRSAERERLAKLGFNLDGTPIKPQNPESK